MKTEEDFEDLLKLFNKNKVKYCVVGGYAVAFHAKPRFTQDMDILVQPYKENALKILRSLNSFGFKSIGLSQEDLAKKGKIIQLGYAPIRIDLLTSIDGCTFDEVWKNKIKGHYGKVSVYFIGLKELIKNKRHTGRPQDKLDLSFLISGKK